MSRRVSSLGLSLRALEKLPSTSSHAPARALAGLSPRPTLLAGRRPLTRVSTAVARRRLHASSVHANAAAVAHAHVEPPALGADAPVKPARPMYMDTAASLAEQRAREDADFARYAQSERVIAERLQAATSLDFPRALARRLLTHASHRDARRGHNARWSFMGRRALEAYFQMFLHETPAGSLADHAALSERLLSTYVFGEHIGLKHWQLASALRWTPPDRRAGRAHHEPDAAAAAGAPVPANTVGLYKVLGGSVEAVLGGAVHQFGGAVGHRLFHTRILPFIPHLPEAYRYNAAKLAERLGGTDAPLHLAAARPAAPPQRAAAPRADTEDVRPAQARSAPVPGVNARAAGVKDDARVKIAA